MLNKERVIAEVAAKHKIRVEPDDPYCAAATITQMALEETVRELQVKIHASIAEFDASVRVVERRAGKILAQEVKDCAAAIRVELQKDIIDANKKSRALINAVKEVKMAHELPNTIMWAAIGLVSALDLYLSGVWLGRLTLGLCSD